MTLYQSPPVARVLFIIHTSHPFQKLTQMTQALFYRPWFTSEVRILIQLKVNVKYTSDSDWEDAFGRPFWKTTVLAIANNAVEETKAVSVDEGEIGAFSRLTFYIPRQKDSNNLSKKKAGNHCWMMRRKSDSSSCIGKIGWSLRRRIVTFWMSMDTNAESCIGTTSVGHIYAFFGLFVVSGGGGRLTSTLGFSLQQRTVLPKSSAMAAQSSRPHHHRVRPRSHSRSSSSPSPPPSPLQHNHIHPHSSPRGSLSSLHSVRDVREKRRSFNVNRTSALSAGGHRTRALSRGAIPAFPNTDDRRPNPGDENAVVVDTDGVGFSTQYGASASSMTGVSGSEQEFLTGLRDETETEVENYLRGRAFSPDEDGRMGIGERASIWGTEEREYRLLLGPLVAAALLHSALSQLSSNPSSPVAKGWNIESPLVLPSTPIRRGASITDAEPTNTIRALSALATSRRNLVQLFTLCSFVLLVHVTRSLHLEITQFRINYPPNSTSPDAEVTKLHSLQAQQASIGTYWLRKGEWKRTRSVVGFSFLVTGVCLLVKAVTAKVGRGVWSVQYLRMRSSGQKGSNPWRVGSGVQCSDSNGHGDNQSYAHEAHRLRLPHEKPVHRRLLALGFYAGSVLICGGLIGVWTKWCLGGRNPFTWAFFFIFEGTHAWTRPALIAYWVALAAISVAGWERQLNRARKHRRYVVPGTAAIRGEGPGGQHSVAGGPAGKPLGLGSGNVLGIATNGGQPGGTTQEGFTGVATQMMDAADQRMPTLSVNARRKSFHALAVIMFIPGIAVDPAFTHLSFSVAFAAFNFVEYVRYFALWPFGVKVHLFLNEFLDHKDSGTAILSHFYLLAGCAAPLWFEG
ncbi:dolichol kinase [Cryptococcus deuterogattii CA1014]|nr:dolichol kinase [Cryptococcus deuterogattii CA1014]